MKTPEERESSSALMIVIGIMLFVPGILIYLIYKIIW